MKIKQGKLHGFFLGSGDRAEAVARLRRWVEIAAEHLSVEQDRSDSVADSGACAGDEPRGRAGRLAAKVGSGAHGGQARAPAGAVMPVPTDWEGDRELARQRFLRSVALALEVLPARDLNFFASRLLYQMDSKDKLGLQAELQASLKAERAKARPKAVGRR